MYSVAVLSAFPLLLPCFFLSLSLLSSHDFLSLFFSFPFFIDICGRHYSLTSVMPWIPLKSMPHSLREHFRVLKSEHEIIMGDGLEFSLPILKDKLLHNKLPSESCRITCNASVVTNYLDEIK